MKPPSRRALLIALGTAMGCGFSETGAPAERALATSVHPDATARLNVVCGIDALAADGFAPLSGLRVGLLTNHTGRDAAGRRTIDVLAGASGVKLAAIFSPEHGLEGDREGMIESGRDARTGLPVHSLFGAARRPSDAMLAGLEALVVDLQDAGVRFHTYATTMGYLLEAAAARRLKAVVLDRPNPIGPAGVRGPMLEPALRSFIGYFPMPVLHAMTLGELAMLFNAESRIGADLTVIPMRFYRRNAWYDETGLSWIAPSPNLKSLSGTVLYPGIALLEAADVSVGRGTPAPFELVGAPWIDGVALARILRDRKISGVRVLGPAKFTPAADRHAHAPCHGASVLLVDRAALDAPRVGIELAAALHRLHPDRFAVRDMLHHVGSRDVLAAIEAGEDPAAIETRWEPALRAFEATRAKYLLYGAGE